MKRNSPWPSNPRSLREWQLARLRGYLRTTVLPFSAHYGALFRREGIDPTHEGSNPREVTARLDESQFCTYLSELLP